MRSGYVVSALKRLQQASIVDVTYTWREKKKYNKYKVTRHLLNKRNEQIFKYRHKNRFKLI